MQKISNMHRNIIRNKMVNQTV